MSKCSSSLGIILIYTTNNNNSNKQSVSGEWVNVN